MYKLIAGFMVFFIINVFLGGIMEGAGGMASTKLTSAVADDTTTLSVRSTQGFLKSDKLFIDNEEVRYVNKADRTFTVATTGRGYNGTTARAHSKGAMVYTRQASVLNGVLGFNVASTDVNVGGINMFVFVLNFALKTVPKLVTWDFAHLKTSEWVLYIRIILMAISAGLTVALILTVMGALGGGQRLLQ